MSAKRLMILAFIIIWSFPLRAQFGKNKVQYDTFDWKYIQSNHFDIYYHDDNYKIAESAAREAEQAYTSIRNLLNWPLQKRYAIILYNSHKAFQQTNTYSGDVSEGTGGFTELFKNRIVLPFEGSYRDFRHVIHHEMVHAVMNDMYFGGSIQSIISGAVTLDLPLWLAEGTAEYESLRWDTQADMFMRDFAFNGQFPPMWALDGYYAYKGGQSIIRFIHETYGMEKLTDFYGSLKATHSVPRSIKRIFNMSEEDFTAEWHKYIQKTYWPDIDFAEDILNISVRLTDHNELGNYQNIAPALSPDGSRIAFLSDRNGYADIFTMRAEDGKDVKKIVSGQRKAKLEELKWLSPGISWSPDSKKIVFAAKSGPSDALVVVDVKTKKQTFYPIEELNGIYSTDWHPRENIIVFSGNNGCQNDIYTYHLDTKTLTNLTRDHTSSVNPIWAPDGKSILYINEKRRSLPLQSFRHPYQNDVWRITYPEGVKEAVTQTDWDEDYAICAPDGKTIIYTSDENGIFNVWIKPETAEPYAVTNILGGVFHLDISRDGGTMVLTAFQNGGWDIYRINEPLSLSPRDLNITEFRKHHYTIETAEPLAYKSAPDQSVSVKKTMPATVSDMEKPERQGEYSKFIFIPHHRQDAFTEGDSVALDSALILTETGDYKVHEYKTRFSLDLVDSQVGYSTFYGIQGQTVFLFSDMMGDHQIGIGTELYIDLKNSDYSISYAYLKNRLNFAATYYNDSNHYYTYYLTDYGYAIRFTRYRNYGLMAGISYPFDRYRRLEYTQTLSTISREVMDIYESYEDFDHSFRSTVSTLAYVKDNVLWSYTAPMDGTRWRVQFDFSPNINTDTPAFNTLSLDFRKYWKFNFDYHIGFRLTSGYSWGRNPQTFLIGGVDNWLNYRYNTNAPIFGTSSRNFSDDMTLYYFSRFVTPVRGTPYFAKYGDKFTVVNAELRFPFLEYAKFRFPLPLNLWQIRGVLFMDAGTAWYDDLTLIQNPDLWPFNNKFQDLIASTGTGIRIYLGYFLLRVDMAWEYDGNGFSKPRYLFSLGGDF